MKEGDKDALALLLEAKSKIHLKQMELQRLLFFSRALLEYEWLTSKTIIEQD